MTYILRFLPEVEDDAIGGYSWYETKSPGPGEEFLRMFYASAGDIPRNPLLYPKVHNEFRRCLLRRFPYAVYFTINNEQIIVAGLFHGARDPRAVESMLQNR
jgi:plasmid stabilization system protein ParE